MQGCRFKEAAALKMADTPGVFSPGGGMRLFMEQK